MESRTIKLISLGIVGIVLFFAAMIVVFTPSAILGEIASRGILLFIAFLLCCFILAASYVYFSKQKSDPLPMD